MGCAAPGIRNELRGGTPRLWLALSYNSNILILRTGQAFVNEIRACRSRMETWRSSKKEHAVELGVGTGSRRQHAAEAYLPAAGLEAPWASLFCRVPLGPGRLLLPTFSMADQGRRLP